MAAASWRDRAALSVAEVAELMGVSARTVRRVYGRHTIKVGHLDRIPTRVVLEALGEAQTTAPASKPRVSSAARRNADRILRSIA